LSQPAVKSNLPSIDDDLGSIAKKFRESAADFHRLLLIAEQEIEILFRVSRRLVYLNYQPASSR
jgi:hypothetical protein